MTFYLGEIIVERQYVTEVTSSSDVIFKDGSSVPDIDIVFCATGFTPNYDIVELEGIRGKNLCFTIKGWL